MNMPVTLSCARWPYFYAHLDLDAHAYWTHDEKMLVILAPGLSYLTEPLQQKKPVSHVSHVHDIQILQGHRGFVMVH